ncbi:MAG: polysaccharide pyruvyl transferase family protein [Pseudomonadota bacterium]
MSVPSQAKRVERTAIAGSAADTPFEVAVFDTAVGSQNLGDQIIMRASMRVLERLFPQAHFWSLPSHDHIGPRGFKRLRHSLFSIACGTNLIHPKMPSRGQWKLPRAWHRGWPFYARLRPRRLALMAVGSNGAAPTPQAARYLQRTLWPGLPISARDQATQRLLEEAEVPAVHTSCVTLWDLPEDHPMRVPRHKAKACVVALTGTRRPTRAAVERDQRLLDSVAAAYETRFLWPQGQVDTEYYLSLARSDFTVLHHSLAAYTDLLVGAESLDFVGARLHAGILALQHGRRPLVVKIDNRAADIGASTGLPVIGGDQFDGLDALIEGARETRLTLPTAAIRAWQNDLRRAVEGVLTPQLDLAAFHGR